MAEREAGYSAREAASLAAILAVYDAEMASCPKKIIGTYEVEMASYEVRLAHYQRAVKTALGAFVGGWRISWAELSKHRRGPEMPNAPVD